MTIFLDSRYVDGPQFKAWDPRKGTYQLTVFREWPTYSTGYTWYTWTEADRLDTVALRFLGDSNRWWDIMDINPQVINPYELAPGTPIRIPNA